MPHGVIIFLNLIELKLIVCLSGMNGIEILDYCCLTPICAYIIKPMAQFMGDDRVRSIGGLLILGSLRGDKFTFRNELYINSLQFRIEAGKRLI